MSQGRRRPVSQLSGQRWGEQVELPYLVCVGGQPLCSGQTLIGWWGTSPFLSLPIPTSISSQTPSQTHPERCWTKDLQPCRQVEAEGKPSQWVPFPSGHTLWLWISCSQCFPQQSSRFFHGWKVLPSAAWDWWRETPSMSITSYRVRVQGEGPDQRHLRSDREWCPGIVEDRWGAVLTGSRYYVNPVSQTPGETPSSLTHLSKLMVLSLYVGIFNQPVSLRTSLCGLPNTYVILGVLFISPSRAAPMASTPPLQLLTILHGTAF